MKGIAEELARWKQMIDEHVERFYAEELGRRDYTSSFYRKVHASLSDYSMRGKRLRSLLMLIGYLCEKGSLDDEDLEKLMGSCVGIELLHSHFLIHDDIVDRDEYRRGGPAMHRRLEAIVPRGAVNERDFGIVAGDLVLAQSCYALSTSDLPPQRLVLARAIIAEAMIETNIGKLYDLLDINRSLDRIEFEHVLFVMTYRTSRYTIQMPLAVGAALAGSDHHQSRFEELANLLGTAFHLYHDLSHLDDGEASQIRRDIRENKKTVLLKWLYDASNEDEKEFLSKLMGTRPTTEDYHRVITLLKSRDIISRAEGYIDELLTDADAEVDKLELSAQGAKYLKYITRALAGEDLEHAHSS
jgi:geranylgeranyl diphosphate synthase, type I